MFYEALGKKMAGVIESTSASRPVPRREVTVRALAPTDPRGLGTDYSWRSPLPRSRIFFQTARPGVGLRHQTEEGGPRGSLQADQRHERHGRSRSRHDGVRQPARRERPGPGRGGSGPGCPVPGRPVPGRRRPGLCEQPQRRHQRRTDRRGARTHQRRDARNLHGHRQGARGLRQRPEPAPRDRPVARRQARGLGEGQGGWGARIKDDRALGSRFNTLYTTA